MTAPGSRPFSRRHLLGGAAAAGLGIAGLAGTGLPAAAADTVTENGLRITKIKNLTGPDITGRFGVHWADLGIAGRCPDGRTLYVFGDTFGPGWGENWRSPTALWSRTRHLNRGVTFSGTPGGDVAEQLIPYEHGDDISTIIPSDVITIGRTMYLHAVVNRGFGNVIWSGIWTSRDNGTTWRDSGARFPADAYDKRWQLATWDQGPDGWVYVYTSEFLRETPMILHRVRPHDLTRPEAYQPWGFDGRRWRWGAEPSDVTDGIIGEASLRRLGHRWLLTWFDGPNYRIDAQVLRHPTQDLRSTPTITLLHGTDWESQDVNHLAQLYGSYIIPGSTLDDTHLTVSQWNTGDNSVYHVMQYRFRGLERRH
jgi:D-arabinan endo alpha-(1,5)-arabinofuranosidase